METVVKCSVLKRKPVVDLSRVSEHLSLEKPLTLLAASQRPFRVLGFKKTRQDLPVVSRKDFQCVFCGSSYSTRGALRTHKSRKHKDLRDTQQAFGSVLCGLCGQGFQTQRDLCNHFQWNSEDGGHDFQVPIYRQTFPDEDSLRQWRASVESEGCFNFVARHGGVKNKDGSSRRLFACHRSGFYRSQAVVRKQQKKGSKKAGFTCTAYLSLQTKPSGIVEAEYCLTHYGHDALPSRCRLPQDVVDQVQHLLRLGYSSREIIDLLQEHSLTMLSIANIRKAAGIPLLRRSERKPSSLFQEEEVSEDSDLPMSNEERAEQLRENIRRRLELLGRLTDALEDVEVLEEIDSKLGETEQLFTMDDTPVDMH